MTQEDAITSICLKLNLLDCLHLQGEDLEESALFELTLNEVVDLIRRLIQSDGLDPAQDEIFEMYASDLDMLRRDPGYDIINGL
jgi:hypothetical protein